MNFAMKAVVLVLMQLNQVVPVVIKIVNTLILIAILMFVPIVVKMVFI